MILLTRFLVGLIIATCIVSCQSNKVVKTTSQTTYTYLALGDSYTKGESVCAACNFPSQLKNVLQDEHQLTIETTQVAQTGWTTSNLLQHISSEILESQYDFVTLLIGVNNQYQGKQFELYQTEFEALLDIAIRVSKNGAEQVIVLSIPDYAYTPYGEASGRAEKISEEIDRYNVFAQNMALEKGVTYIDVTSITREGLTTPALVARDGLHPSKSAYTRFVEQLIKVINEKGIFE